MSTTATTNKKSKKSSPDFKSLVGKTDPKIDAQARERLITARIGLLLRQAFFGNLATRLRLINADDWCETAATDGLNFYYNSRFIMMLKPKEVEFLVGHEVLHVVYDHIGRRDHRDPQLFNIANDYAVNADLKKHNIGEFITTVPCLYDEKYKDMSSEEIYDLLYQNAEKISIDDLADMLLDDHLDGDDGDGGDDGEEGDGKRRGRRPTMSDEERERVRQDIKQAIIAAAQGAEAGTLPKGVERMIRDVTEPTMPWNELIQTTLTSAIRTDYSLMRPSRRAWHIDAILPGMMPGEEIDVDIAIDMSGSIGDAQAKSFLGEIGGIMSAFDGFKIHVFCFDTSIYNPRSYTSENLDTIDDYQPQGGGGTDFDCVYDYLKREGRNTKRLIMFTDGYPCGSWGDPDFCDTTFIIHGNKEIRPPFGTWAYLD